jgi:hypothetical protein
MTFEQRPYDEDKGLCLGLVIQDEEDRLEVKSLEEVEPTEVVHHPFFSSKENNLWIELRLQRRSFWSHQYT